MSRINIKVKQVKTANKDLVNLSSRVDRVGNQISSVRHQVDGRIVSRRSIGRNLNEAAAKVRETEKKLKKIHQFVDVSMDLYVIADKKADRFKEPEKKSVWDKMKDLFGTANDVVSGFRKGVAEAIFSTVEGIWNAITHPIETAKGIVYAVSHPVETAKSIWKSISDSWMNDVINGDAKSRSQWFGRAIGEAALAIIGTKGVDKAVKMAKGAKVVEEAGGVRVVKPETLDKKDGGVKVEKSVTPGTKDNEVGIGKREVPHKIDGKVGIGDNGIRTEKGNHVNVNTEVYGPYYDEAKKLYEKNPDWYPNPDESTVVKGDELKEVRADYQALVRRGELEKGHHRQGLAFGGENVNSNIQKTGESTIRREQIDDLNLDFYHEMGYGKKDAKILKIHENEDGIILFGNNPQHTEVTTFQNKVLKWQRDKGKR